MRLRLLKETSARVAADLKDVAHHRLRPSFSVPVHSLCAKENPPEKLEHLDLQREGHAQSHQREGREPLPCTEEGLCASGLDHLFQHEEDPLAGMRPPRNGQVPIASV